MNTSIKFKDFNRIQKIGYILIMVAAVMTLAKLLNVMNVNHFVVDDLASYIFLAGGLLVLIPFMSRWVSKNQE